MASSQYLSCVKSTNWVSFKQLGKYLSNFLNKPVVYIICETLKTSVKLNLNYFTAALCDYLYTNCFCGQNDLFALIFLVGVSVEAHIQLVKYTNVFTCANFSDVNFLIFVKSYIGNKQETASIDTRKMPRNFINIPYSKDETRIFVHSSPTNKLVDYTNFFLL